MLKFDPDYLETKNIWKYIVKKLLFAMVNVSHCCKTHEICYKIFLKNVLMNKWINGYEKSANWNDKLNLKV